MKKKEQRRDNKQNKLKNSTNKKITNKGYQTNKKK